MHVIDRGGGRRVREGDLEEKNMIIVRISIKPLSLSDEIGLSSAQSMLRCLCLVSIQIDNSAPTDGNLVRGICGM